jgi:hypothetical protein
VKRYIREAGSEWVLGLLDVELGHELFVASVTAVEITAAITRRTRCGDISPIDASEVRNQLRSDLQTDYQIVEITRNIIISGMDLAERYGLRGYDAIQLSTGCTVNALCTAYSEPPVVFVSADNELNGAALREGLVIENPNSHQ